MFFLHLIFLSRELNQTITSYDEVLLLLCLHIFEIKKDTFSFLENIKRLHQSKCYLDSNLLKILYKAISCYANNPAQVLATSVCSATTVCVTLHALQGWGSVSTRGRTLCKAQTTRQCIPYERHWNNADA